MDKRGVFVYFSFNPHHFDKEFAIIFEHSNLAHSFIIINVRARNVVQHELHMFFINFCATPVFFETIITKAVTKGNF